MAPASTQLDREGERLRRTVGSIPGPPSPALEANALPLGPSDVLLQLVIRSVEWVEEHCRVPL